ncbi:MAG: NAD(P)/FAD-dependent oxidoreductase [Actinomycetota bacterium]
MTTSPDTHDHPTSVDVAIVGGSAAGLAAALQLARQERSVAVVDDQTPRNLPASHLHGYLGFDGRPPADLVAAGRDDLAAYGAHLITDRVTEVDGDVESGFTVARAAGTALTARRVLVATGLRDELPVIDGLAEHWGDTVIHCPFCHGYEHRARRHVHLATMPASLHPAPLFRHLAEALTVVVEPSAGVDPSALDALRGSGVDVIVAPIVRVLGDDGSVRAVELADGRSIDAEVVSITPEVRARVEVFRPIGLAAQPHPMGIGDHLVTDPTGQTTVAGVYAAGNVTDPSHQLLQAAADGARVGAMIAFDLAA